MQPPLEDLKQNPNLKRLSIQQLIFTVGLATALFAAAGIISYFYQDEIARLAHILAEGFGIWGLALMVFIGDGFICPLPPDVALFIIAKSDLNQHWPTNVMIIALASVTAAQFGWVMGLWIRKHNWAPQFIVTWIEGHKKTVLTYGKWAVVLGALTPLPFSLTCWGAGFIGMKWKSFFWASLWRLPRIYFYFFALQGSNFFG